MRGWATKDMDWQAFTYCVKDDLQMCQDEVTKANTLGGVQELQYHLDSRASTDTEVIASGNKSG